MFEQNSSSDFVKSYLEVGRVCLVYPSFFLSFLASFVFFLYSLACIRVVVVIVVSVCFPKRRDCFA